jgi:alpha-tubulin suppressor-like RCC1 family protein
VCEFGTISESSNDCLEPPNYEATESLCDGLDNDCNGTTDPDCACINGETQNCGTDVGQCSSGQQECSGGTWSTCVGETESVTEICDGLDNDCDGDTDEGLLTTYYVDSDNDGYGSANTTNVVEACNQPTGYAPNALDCNDNTGDAKPGAQEVCNDTLDNDCNGAVNDGCPCNYDGKTEGVCANSSRDTSGNCKEPIGYQAVEFGCGATSPGTPDGLDNDCDGIVDEATGTRISTGAAHACLLHMGQIYCWGREWAPSGTVDHQTPYHVAHPSGETFTMVSTGANHTCAVDSNNDGYCWGIGNDHRLGNGATTDRYAPTKVTGSGSNSVQFQSISAGGDHSCGITTSGTVVCWGANNTGQCGSVSNGTPIQHPTAVTKGGSTLSATRVSAGHDFTCALTNQGALYCWGNNDKGQLGAGAITIGGTTVTSTHVPRSVWTSGVDTIDTGYAHACITHNGGDGYCWGDDSHQRLGNGNASHTTTPFAVVGGNSFANIRVGRYNSCGIENNSDNGMCWGESSYGAIGNGTTSNIPEAQPVDVTGVPRFARIDVGTRFACGIGKNNNVYCWGADSNGNLGNGTAGATDHPTPVRCF